MRITAPDQEKDSDSEVNFRLLPQGMGIVFGRYPFHFLSNHKSSTSALLLQRDIYGSACLFYC